MARRANPAAGQAETIEHDEHVSMPGGAPGIYQDATRIMNDMRSATAYREPDPDAPPPPEVKKYRVMNSQFILYNSCRVTLPVGKIVDGRSYDLDLLRNQGVVLNEVA